MGALKRLMSEDWDAMTAAANRSSAHVSSMERWRAKALESNPGLSPDQADRLAEKLKRAHYQRMNRLSQQAKKIATTAAAELASDDE